MRTAVPPAPVSQKRWEELTSTLIEEARLIDSLCLALLDQRAGVAADDAEVVDHSVHAIGRCLLTLNEARRRRGSLVQLLAGSPEVSIEALESALGLPLPKAVLVARDQVRRAARIAASELAINQRILRGALEAGDAFIQHLFAAVAVPKAGYRQAARAGDAGAGSGILVNRVV